MTLDLLEVERRMQPGAWFTHGFLLKGTSLAEVLANDARALAALGVSAEQVGQRLSKLLESGAKSDWFWPFRTGEYKVEIRRRRGFITCPWALAEFEPCAVGQLSFPTANQCPADETNRKIARFAQPCKTRGSSCGRPSCFC